MINIFSSSRYKINRKVIKQKTEDIIRKFGLSPSLTINIIFIGKTKMKSLALTYKKENLALPVLSFPYKKEPIDNTELLGEIFLCYPQVVLLAAERNRKVEETILAMIKHGLENLIE